MSTATTICDIAAPAISFDAEGNPVFNVAHQEQARAERLAAEPYKLAMPETAMYGIAADIARAVEGPLGPCYLTVLTFLASLGAKTTEPELTTRLYAGLIAPPGVGKSRIQNRVRRLLPQIEDRLLRVAPASHHGLVQDFAPGKDDPPIGSPQHVPPHAVYALDELVDVLDACNIPGSGKRFAATLCTLFYESLAGSSDKKGKHHISAQINMVGSIMAADAVSFRKVFGSNTLGGLYDRFLLAPMPRGFIWAEEDEEGNSWNPQPYTWDTHEVIPESVFDDAPRPSTTQAWRPMRHAVSISTEARRMAIAWRATPPPGAIIGDPETDGKRSRLMELAKRVAVISAAANGDREVSAECMTAALSLMEWQERVRKVYSPSEGTDKADEFAAEVEQRFKEAQADRPPGYFFRWRDIGRKHNWSNRYVGVAHGVKQYLISTEQLIRKQIGEDKEGNPKYDNNLLRWYED